MVTSTNIFKLFFFYLNPCYFMTFFPDKIAPIGHILPHRPAAWRSKDPSCWAHTFASARVRSRDPGPLAPPTKVCKLAEIADQ